MPVARLPKLSRLFQILLPSNVCFPSEIDVFECIRITNAARGLYFLVPLYALQITLVSYCKETGKMDGYMS